MKYNLLVLAAIASSLTFGGGTPDGAQLAVPGDWPDPAVWRADDGTLYSVATGLRSIRTSRDLVTWTDLKRDPLTSAAWQRLSSFVSRRPWAPNVVRLGNKWLLYVSLFKDLAHCHIDVLESDSPTGPFSHCGTVIDSTAVDITCTIDSHVVSDAGRLWMFFGSYPDGVHLVELEPDGKSVKAGARPRHIAGSRRTAHRDTCQYEGAYAFRRGKYWYLFLSSGSYNSWTYHLVVGRSERIEGPYLDRNGNDLRESNAPALLASGRYDRINSPGHNGDIISDGQGRTCLYYHAHATPVPGPETGPYVPRSMFVQRLEWAADGWPVVSGERVVPPAPPTAADEAALDFVDPMIGAEGAGSEYGGMTPMTGVPFGSMHLIPVTRTNAVGRTSFNALDKNLLGFILSRQPAIWMGEFGPVRIWLDRPLPLEGIDAHPWKTVVRAGGHTYELAADSHAALIRSDDPSLGASLAATGVTTERTARVSMRPIPNFACHWQTRRTGNTLAVGVSLVSAANAAKFVADVPTDVDALASRVKAQWLEFFRRVSIEADDTVKRIFYTGLYHALLYPRDLSEFGSYYSAVDDRVHDGPGYSCFSLWDTYRSEHPLLLIVAPERAAAMMQSLVDMYTWGGWLPIWPNPGYTGVMIGDPAAVVLSEAVVKRLGGFNWQDAFAAVKKNADVPQPDDAARTWLDRGKDEPGSPETRGGLTWYLKKGYVAHDRCVESVSRTLDYSLADASIARFAEAMGETADAARYRARAKNYTNLWHATRKAFLPKRLDGTWVDPSTIAHRERAYTETDAMSARWCVPHDVAGMVALMGGAEAFERELDRFFEREFYRTDAVGNVSVHGNETCHHVAYLYNRIGRYDKTCRRVRDILTRCYSTSRKGFDGNEDCGAMSAWYVFSSLGLYPLDPASGVYELGCPSVRQATLALADGRRLVIRAKGALESARVRRVTFNGQELPNRQIPHARLTEGGVLEFEFQFPGGQTPIPWGTDPDSCLHHGAVR